MRFSFFIIIGLIIFGWIFISALHADELVLTTGERFTTSKIWEENGTIRFNMNGLVVSVNKTDVAAVIGPGGPAQSAVHSKPQSPLQSQPGQVHPPVPQASTAPDTMPSLPSQLKKHLKKENHKSKIQGIGFKGISWHMQPTDLPGLEKIKTEQAYGGIDQYWRPDGLMTLGDVLLDGLVFGFWRNRLYSIMIWVEGRSAYDNLERVVLELYGAGRKSENHQSRYVWLDDRTTDRMLEFDEQRDIGIFWMRSRELDRHIKKIYPES